MMYPDLTSFYLYFLGVRLASTLVSQFEDSVQRLPMREAVRYVKGNMKWTAADVKMYVDGHANALIDHGFVAGETMAIWLPESAEKVFLDENRRIFVVLSDRFQKSLLKTREISAFCFDRNNKLPLSSISLFCVFSLSFILSFFSFAL